MQMIVVSAQVETRTGSYIICCTDFFVLMTSASHERSCPWLPQACLSYHLPVHWWRAVDGAVRSWGGGVFGPRAAPELPVIVSPLSRACMIWNHSTQGRKWLNLEAMPNEKIVRQMNRNQIPNIKNGWNIIIHLAKCFSVPQHKLNL